MKPESKMVVAARWRVRAETGGARREELEAWLEADPENRKAFDDVESVWRYFDDVREEAPMQSTRLGLRGRFEAARRRRRVIRASMAAGLAAIGLLTAVFLSQTASTRVYEASGRRAVELPDGSRVLLDTGSKLEVRYTPLRRELELEAGEARFNVAHDALRPFMVSAGEQQVVATGTVFNVEVSPRAVAVALLEGKVTIVGAGHAAQPIKLRQGEQYVAGPQGVAVQRFDPDVVSAWESGLVILNDTALDEAVRQVNKHADVPIVLTAPGADRLTVSGVFNAGQTYAFAEAVTSLLPELEKCQTPNAITLTPRAQGPPACRGA